MPHSYQLYAFPVTIFAHLLFIAVATLVLIWLLKFREGVAVNFSNKSEILNLHTLMMMIGFVLVGGEAVIVHKAFEVKSRSVKVVHLLLHLIALASGIFGVILVFKAEVHPHHMVTLHSWLGMIAICSFGLQYMLAFCTYFFPRAEMSTRASLKPWHRLIGMVIFLLAACTAETGIVQRFQFLELGRNREALILNFSGLLLFLFAVSVGLSVILPRYH
ncbi:probable ascorbate-specific transmembrane electron transporter 1 [Prosopis cineraria]|uniref:probable ascorbate-specific transmembrane electron transporter 1 n=1 Tax=Prosopis cineraria TaxID=364024 RepID=UPI0024108D99|nr:probable ascorbate-specific transmembrane electron transporter 1 [Prosopis cineraria]